MHRKSEHWIKPDIEYAELGHEGKQQYENCFIDGSLLC